jgi:hypothetical protein
VESSQVTHTRSTQRTCRACYGLHPELRDFARRPITILEEITMTSGTTESKKWGRMSAGQKAAFVGKLCIFLITFGFAFPTMLND